MAMKKEVRQILEKLFPAQSLANDLLYRPGNLISAEEWRDYEWIKIATYTTGEEIFMRGVRKTSADSREGSA